LKVPSDLLARTDITSTRKLILSYFQLRSGINNWTFNATDISITIGICYRTAKRELKDLESNGIIKCIGYSSRWQKRYKKYILIEQDKMSFSRKGQNVPSRKGQNVPLEEVQKKEVPEVYKKESTEVHSTPGIIQENVEDIIRQIRYNSQFLVTRK